MSPFLPAARAHQAVRHPALDVGFRRNPHYIDPPPGAGSTLLGLDPRWDYEYGPDDNPYPVAPVYGPGPPTTTTTTVAQVSPVVGIPSFPHGLSSFNPFPIYTPTSSSLSSTLTSSATTPPNTRLDFQGPRFGSTTLPAMIAATPSADSNPVLAGAAGGAAKRSGPSGGAIAAIVIVILLATGALAFFLLRRRRIQRRTARRATWNSNGWGRHIADASLEKGVTEINPISLADIGAASSTRGNEGGAAQSKVATIPRKSPPPHINITQTDEASPTQPRSYSSPVQSSAPSPQPSVVRTVASGSTQGTKALVRVMFVTQLPDELAITPGETVYIRTEYDDGWAWCANTRGEKGMVPLECLDGGGGQTAEFSAPSIDWHNRDSRRVSSLRSVA